MCQTYVCGLWLNVSMIQTQHISAYTLAGESSDELQRKDQAVNKEGERENKEKK